MPLTKSTIGPLTAGISQQPQRVRRQDQAELIENAQLSVVSGMGQREPREHIAKLTGLPAGDYIHHSYTRDRGEQYDILISPSFIRVFDITDGSEKTVTIEGDLSYLATVNPKEDLIAVTIGDVTFIVNKSVTVAMEAPTGGSIAKKIVKFSDAPLETDNGTPADFSDDVAHGDIYEVTGDPSNQFDSYYLQFFANSGTTGEGTWVEVVRPGISTEIDQTTMPHLLASNADGTFTFKTIDWNYRESGDELSNPDPSFVGQQISNLFFFQERIGIVAKDNIALSGTSDYFNFFRQTSLAILDTDPIDFAILSHNPLNILYVSSSQGQLMVHTEEDEWIVSGGDNGLSPSSISVTRSTNFGASKLCKPTSAGSTVYFADQREKYGRIWEYFIIPDTAVNDAADITSHCPFYLEGDLVQMVTNSTSNALFCRVDGEANALFVYNTYYNGDEKVQGAWHKWTLDADIEHIHLFKDIVYLTLRRPDGLYLEHIRLDSTLTESLIDSPSDPLPRLRLDRRTDVQGVYDALNDKTVWTIPYEVSEAPQVVRGRDFSGQAGSPVEGVLIDGGDATKVYAEGNHSAGLCAVGFTYLTRYKFSEIYVRDQNGAARHYDRLQVKTLSLDYTQTSYFRVVVTRPHGGSKTTVFTGKKVGSVNNKIGSIVLSDGSKMAQILGRNYDVDIEIQSDSYLPFTITGAAWQGTYTDR